MKERLQKIISTYGIASRRASEKLILDGCVSVNGVTAKLGDSADPDSDLITINGKALINKPGLKYVLLYKPRGVVTTLSDEKGRKTVRDCLPQDFGYLVPVGRLDLSSEGLLIMTNDGEFVKLITHPSHEVEKTYMAWVEGDLQKAVPLMKKPVEMDGTLTSPAQVKALAENMLLITIREGKNRQVRRICEACGLRVTRLKRVSEGGLELGGMKPGEWRCLSGDEVAMLKGKAKSGGVIV